METGNEVLLADDLDIEKGFNDAIDDLRKSLGQGGDDPSVEELEKAKSDPSKKGEDDDDAENDDDDDEEKGNSYRKSIEDVLREEPEAAAAMDVEPFLLQLAKAFDEGIEQLQKAVTARVGKVEKLVKSIGNATLKTAELQKSTHETMQKIGDMPIPSRSLTRLSKSRFEIEGNDPQEYDNHLVLVKSRDWVKTGKIDLTEAGIIEGRINKNLLGKSRDRIDQKVAALMREGEAS